MKFLLSFAAVLAALAATPPAPAAQLGDPAKPLRIAEWIKGKPADLAAGKGKQIFVVEFWATWCGPCRTSIPHLTELQKKFKDVVFVGISDESPATVKKFVEKMGDKMDYRVAVDTDRKTSADYMGAFGVNGIPHAFIVDKEGRIVWHGHPMAGMEQVLEEIVAGKFDLGKARKRADAMKKLEEFYELASEGGDEAKLDKLGKEVEGLDAELGGIQPGRKFNAAETRQMITFRSALREYQTTVGSDKDAAKLASLEKKIADTAPPGFSLPEFKESVALNQKFIDYYRAASGQGDTAALPELAKALTDAKTQNARALSQWAWTILTDTRLKTRDLELATKLAQAAVEASGGKDPAAFHTYARAQFDSGKVSEAIQTEKKAIAAADDEDMRQELEATLKEYEKKLAAK